MARRPAPSADGSPGVHGLGLFVSAEYETFDKDVTRFESGFTSDTWSGTVGVDYSFTSWATAGIAFTYSSVSGTYAERGGDFDTESVGACCTRRSSRYRASSSSSYSPEGSRPSCTIERPRATRTSRAIS
jgi:Autotransporter beta-domain